MLTGHSQKALQESPIQKSIFLQFLIQARAWFKTEKIQISHCLSTRDRATVSRWKIPEIAPKIWSWKYSLRFFSFPTNWRTLMHICLFVNTHPSTWGTFVCGFVIIMQIMPTRVCLAFWYYPFRKKRGNIWKRFYTCKSVFSSLFFHIRIQSNCWLCPIFYYI